MPDGEVYRTPEERFRDLPGYPFEPHYAEIDGLRMHYVDEGAGEPILLLHGEPTWSYLYRKMIPILSGRWRVVAPDLFGFGRSDKPTDRAFYTYERHVASIAALLERLDLTGITAVVQDWGGPVGFRVATEHPERFARLVALNTGVLKPGDRWPTEGFLRWRAFAEQAGLDLPAGSVMRVTAGSEVPADVLAAYDAPYPVRESRTGAAMFPLLVPISHEDPSAAAMHRVAEALSRWEKPTLVLFGADDPIFPAASAWALANLIPGAGEPEFLDGAGHFLQEDRGEDIAHRIVRFLEETS